MISLRIAQELTHQLGLAHEDARLIRSLAKIEVFLPLYRSDDCSDVMIQLRDLHKRGFEIESYFRESMQRLLDSGGRQRLMLEAFQQVTLMLESRGAWSDSRDLTTSYLEWAEASGNRSYVMNAHLRLGIAFWRLGENELARAHYDISLGIARELDDLLGISSAESNIGLLLFYAGDYPGAMDRFMGQLRIREELRDTTGLARTHSRIGNIHYSLGEYEKAKESYEMSLTLAKSLADRSETAFACGNIAIALLQLNRLDEAQLLLNQQYEISEALGARESMSKAVFNSGALHMRRGELEAARASFEQGLAFSREVGDKKSEGLALGNIGEILFEEGKYQNSIDIYYEKLVLSEALSDKRGVAVALGGIGRTYAWLGEYELALEHLTSALASHRAIGNLHHSAHWLNEIAQALLSVAALPELPVWLGNYVPELEEDMAVWRTLVLNEARENAVEALAISEQLAKQDTLFQSRILLARIDAAEHKVRNAREALEKLLLETKVATERADIHFWIWRIIKHHELSAETAKAHSAEALARYIALITVTPKFEYRKRIAELRGEPIPMSADDIQDD